MLPKCRLTHIPARMLVASLVLKSLVIANEVQVESGVLRDARSLMVSITPIITTSDRQEKPSVVGLVVTDDGSVLTSCHLMGKAAEFQVEFPNGRRFISKSMTFDAETDVAIIRLELNEKLTVLDWSDKKDVEVGAPVLCVAVDPQKSAAVARGIISAKVDNVISHEPHLLIDVSNGAGVGCSIVIDRMGKVAGFIGHQAAGSHIAGRISAIPSYRIAQIVRELSSKGTVERTRK